MSKFKISVVVPTHNEEKGIEKFLNQFNRQTLPRDKFEIVIVDGNSTDKTREIAKKYADNIVIQKNRGIAGARNDGVEISEACIIATTDSDVILPHTWLEQIIEHFETDEDLVLVFGPNLPNSRNKSINFTYFLKDWLNFIGAGLRLFYLCSGTNTAFRKKPFLDVGGYYHMFIADDVEITSRIKKHGKIKYDRNIIIYSSVRRVEKYGLSRWLIEGIKGGIKLLFYGKDYQIKDRSKEDYSTHHKSP